jgi:hypothetical protein
MLLGAARGAGEVAKRFYTRWHQPFYLNFDSETMPE